METVYTNKRKKFSVGIQNSKNAEGVEKKIEEAIFVISESRKHSPEITTLIRQVGVIIGNHLSIIFNIPP